MLEGVRFDAPMWLWVMLLAIPMVASGFVWFHAMSLFRRVVTLAVRVLLVVVIALILARPTHVERSERLAVVCVLDVSGSVREFASTSDETGVLDDVMSRLQTMSLAGDDDLLGLVVFDGAAVAVATPSVGGDGGLPTYRFERETSRGTALADAIRLGASMLPSDANGRLVLVSDGNETRGDAMADARAVVRDAGVDRQVRLDVVPLPYAIGREVSISEVDVPPTTTPGNEIVVRVAGMAAGAVSGRLELEENGETVDLNGDAPGVGLPVRRSFEGDEEDGGRVGGAWSRRIQVPASDRLVRRFRARFIPDAGTDTALANNAGEGVSVVRGGGGVLIIGDGGTAGRTLASAFERQGIANRQIDASEAPTDLLALQAFDAVVLDDVPADALSASAQRTLVEYVTRLGGGFVMVGGRNSFGAGGWRGTDVEQLLPVRLDLPQRMIVPPVAIVLVIDSSGSMARSVMGSSRTQQRIANDAAAAAIRSLDPQDFVGVITFANGHRVLVPLGPNTDSEQTAKRVLSASPGGGTNLPPALEEARQALARVDAEKKHVIVLTDGDSQGRAKLPILARRMTDEGIMVSTIGIGDDADVEILREMAEIAGGKHYEVRNPVVLPKLLLRAVRVVRKPMVRERPFAPIITRPESSMVRGLGRVPQLGGLSLTSARQDATALVVATTPEGEPLLAEWGAGAGRVVAFTSDSADWAAQWLTWDAGEGFARFWGQVIRRVRRSTTGDGGEVVARIVDGALSVSYVDPRGEADDVEVGVYEASGERRSLTLRPVGAGRFEGVMTLEDAGSGVGSASAGLVVMATARDDGRPREPIVVGVRNEADREFDRLQSNDGLLRELASVGRGRLLAREELTSDVLFDRTGFSPRFVRQPMDLLLLWWAFALMLVDVGTRRVAWDRLRLGGVPVGDVGAPVRSVVGAGGESGGLLDAVRGARERRTADGGQLGDDDAVELVRRARRSRGEDGEARVGERGSDDDTGSASEGLFAAKRRARERMDEEGGAG